MYQSPLNFKCIFDSLLLIAVCSVQLGTFIIRHCMTPLSQELQKAVHPGPLFVFLKGVCCTFFFSRKFKPFCHISLHNRATLQSAVLTAGWCERRVAGLSICGYTSSTDGSSPVTISYVLYAPIWRHQTPHQIIVNYYNNILYIFFYLFATVGWGLLIVEGSWSYSDTPHSVGLLCTSDQPDAETSTWQHTKHSQQIDIHVRSGIRTHNPVVRERL